MRLLLTTALLSFSLLLPFAAQAEEQMDLSGCYTNVEALDAAMAEQSFSEAEVAPIGDATSRALKACEAGDFATAEKALDEANDLYRKLTGE